MVLNRVFETSKLRMDRHYKIGYVDGVPFYESEYDLLLQRKIEDYNKIKEWVDTELMPYMTRKSFNERHSSYGLKHTAENELGFYVSNGDIKLILLEKGVPFKFEPGSPNTVYPLSQMFYRRKNINKLRD